MSGSHNSKYYVKRLSKKDANACMKLDAFGFTTQTPAKADQPVVSLPETTTEPTSTSTLSSCEPATDTKSLTETSKEVLPTSKTQPEEADMEIKTDQNDSKPESSSDSDSQSEDVLKSKKAKIDLRQDLSKYQYNYPWLYWNVPKNGYICKFCELFSTGTETKWVEVGVNLGTHPSRKIEKHRDSERHIKSTHRYAEVNAAFLAKSRKKPIYQQILDSVKDKDKSERARNRDILKKLFLIAHFIARKYWAQRNFEDLVRFIASLGVEDLIYHLENAPDDATYLSSTSVTEFIDIIAKNIENKLLTSLRNASYYTLLADESTDEQNREQLSIYARWPSTSSMPVDHFLGIIHVQKTNAESLLNAIQGFLVAKGLDITKCCFVGFDGANVMSGEVSGLQRRIRHLFPFCLYMNCRNHRLALCLKHLMKDYPLLVEADSVLLSMWKLFEYSPQRFAVFLSVQEAYGEEQITLIRAATTRWLSHGMACIRFIDRYQAVIDTLDSIYDERKEAEVFGLRTMIMQKNTVAMILLLCDVLRPINVLSLCLQDSSINFMDVDTKVKAATNELENLMGLLRANDDSTYFYKCTEIFQEIDDRTDLQRRLRGDGFLPPDRFLETIGFPFVYSLIGELSDAFQCHPVFKAFRALDPRCLPDDVRDLPDFGKADMNTLADHYGTRKEDNFKGHTTRSPPDIDDVNIFNAEYTGFKHQMYMMRQSGQATTPSQLTAAFLSNPVLRQCFGRMFQMVQMMNIVPTSTAAVERGFSVMNLICTPLRSCLTQNSLQSLMSISIEGPEELSADMLEELVEEFRLKNPESLNFNRTVMLHSETALEC